MIAWKQLPPRAAVIPALVFAAACVDRLPVDELPCPCGPGWICEKSAGGPGICRQPAVDRGINDLAKPEDNGTSDVDNTCSWKSMNSASSVSLFGIWGSGPSDVFAVGYPGAVFHYDGENWQAQPTPAIESQLLSVWGIGSSNVYAVGCQTLCTATSNAATLEYDGKRWATMPAPSVIRASDIWGTNPSNLFASASLGRMYHYDGKAWQLLFSGSLGLNSIWGGGEKDIYTCGNGGTVKHYNGKNWTALGSQTTSHLEGIWGIPSGEVIAVGGPELNTGPATIIRKNGASWTAEVQGKYSYLKAVWGSGPSSVYAVGLDGTILRYDGETWAAMKSGTETHLFDVWGTGPRDVYAVGWFGTILHYTCIPK